MHSSSHGKEADQGWVGSQSTLRIPRTSQPPSLAVALRRSTRTELESSLRETKRELNASHKRFASIIDGSVDAIVILSTEGLILFVNPAAEKLFDRSAEELVGSRLGVPVVERECFELDIVRQDGQSAIVELRVIPSEWLGEPALIATMRDVTERRQLEEELHQARKMEAVGRLAGGVAHDFNNLLQAIAGYCDAIRMSPGADTALLERLDQISDVTSRAAHLTRHLLAVSRSQVMRLEVVNLGDIVRDMSDMLRRLMGEHVEFRVEADATADAWVRVDRAQIEQVILNLVLNARDAMPAGGEILIKVDLERIDVSRGLGAERLAPGEYVTLSVSDTGVGMDEATRARIFEPFFTTKARGAGSGLGLAAVHGIVHQSGGKIFVLTCPGAGTTFRVLLPAVAAEVRPTEPLEREQVVLRPGATILLVEDDDAVREVTSEILSRNGYHVLEASNGAAALARAENYVSEIDLLISDLVMPKMNGRELVEALRARRPSLRVILMSGYADDEQIQQEGLPADVAFLAKPFALDALLARVGAMLKDAPERRLLSSPVRAACGLRLSGSA